MSKLNGSDSFAKWVGYSEIGIRKSGWRGNPVRALKRFQRLAKIFEGFPQFYNFVFIEDRDLNFLKKHYRSDCKRGFWDRKLKDWGEPAKMEDMEKFDLLKEFIDLLFTFKFVCPPHSLKSHSKIVKLEYKDEEIEFEVIDPSILRSIAYDTFLFHESKIYHNYKFSFEEHQNNDGNTIIETQCIRKKQQAIAKDKFDHFLARRFGLTVQDLQNLDESNLIRGRQPSTIYHSDDDMD